MSDVPKDTSSPADTSPPESTTEKLLPKGIAAAQGNTESHPSQDDVVSPSQKGSDFENRVREEVFQGEGKRLIIHPEDNPHLDKFGDGVGISKNRRIADVYSTADGAIWELKSGYEKGGIDQDQLFEYSLMERAGHVYTREGGEKVKVPVTSINYLFETETAAQANEPYLRGLAAPWYMDKNGKVQLLKDYAKE